jgi:hypothetical protein
MPEPKLSVAEFAAKVKSKYPQYADVDDSLLVGKMVEKYPVYADQVNLDVKKKESSEASDSLFSEELSASATSAEVPAPFGEVPKFEGTKDKEPQKTRQQVIEEQRAAQAQKFADIGSYVGQSIAEGVVSANTFLNRAVETLLLGNNTNYFSSNSAKLLEPLNQEKERLQSEYVGEETVGKGIVETFQENPLTGAKLIAFEAGRQVPQMYAMGAIGRATMAAEGATAAGLRTGSILAPRTKLVKKIAEDVAPMVPLGMSSAGQAYLDAAEKNPEDDFIDAVTNLAVATYKGTGEIASELMFRTSVDDLIRGGFRKGLVSDIAKSTRPTLQAAKQVGKDVAVEGFQEGLEELAVEISSNAMDALVFGEDMFSKSNVYGMADAFILGSAIGSPITLLSKGPSAIGTANNINKRRNISEEINDLYDVHQDPNTSASEKAVVKGQIINKLAELKQVENNLASFYEEFSEEDRNNVISLNQELSMAQLIYPELKNEQSKDALQEKVKQIYSEKTKIESKYDPNIKVYEYDSQEEVRVPSPVVEGEAVVEAEPVQVASGTSPEAGRVLQVLEQQEVFKKIAEGQEVDNAEATNAQQQILDAIDEVESLDIADDVKTAYIQTLEDKFDDIEYYDNRTITTTEQVTEEVPVGAPRAGSRTVVEPEVRRGKFRLFERLDNLEVAVGTEADNQTSVIETQDDGSIDVVTYDKTTKQEVGRQPKVADNILGLEYVESILDDAGNVTGVVMRPKTPKGQDISPLRIEVVNRPELALDIAIDARKKEIGDVPEVIWMQEYETVTRDVTTKERVPVAERPERRGTRVVLPTEAVEEEVVETVKEEKPKNRKNLSEAEVTEAVSQADRLAKRLGLPVTIITHNSRKEYNENVSAVSKASLDKAGVESGRFIPSRNEIHLNLEDMNAVVPFHEVFHAAFINRFAKGSQKTRQKTAEDFYSGLVKILRNGNEQDQLLADAADSFVKSGNYTPEETPEEFMAQVAGFISTSVERISKSTMDKLIQWLNNFIGKISPSLKINSRGEFIDFMNSFSGALFESSTDKSLEEIAEEGSYTPEQPATMPDLSEMSSKRTFAEDAPDFIKNNIANLKSLAGRKIPFAVFYDNTRVGKSTLKNSVTGKESDRNLMGGFGYSQIEGVKFDDNGQQVSVLAFTNEDMAARKLSEFLRKEGDLIPVAMQNTQTGHLGNLDVVYEMFDDVNGVVSTAPALYAEKQTGKKSGPEFEAAKKEAEQEILGAIKQSVVELSEKTEVKKNKDGTTKITDRVKAARKIKPMLDKITTLAEWRDKVLLGEWDSFGTRGLFNAYLLQAKPSKVTKATRDTHKVLHAKYGVPTIKEIEDGITEQAFSNAELGDVIKFVSPNKTAVIYTTDPIHKDLPKEGVQKKSDKMTYTLKYIGDQVDSHVSYPYILAGKNDGFAPFYIDITEIFPDLRGKVKKTQSFYAAGRRNLTAPSGELELSESASRNVRAEILDKEQESFADRAKRTATSFVWSPTQKKIRVFKERMSSQLSVEGREIKKFVKKLNTLINKADTETIDLVNKVFDGTLTPQEQNTLESKPSGSLIFGQANAMRNYIDSFADDFVNSPEFHALPEETVNTIIDNFGQYMRGSYRFWKDKDYKPSNDARRDAIVYEYEIIRAKKIEQLVNKEGFNEDEAGEFFELLHDETLAEATKAIDDYIAEIEKIRNGDDFKKLGIISPSSIKLPSEQFMRRKELPETIQALLGKETDPIIRFIDTTIALSNIKYKGHMLYAISEALGGTSFIKNEVTKAELDSKEYREVKDKFSPLNGRFVHKDVYEAITDQKIYDSDRLWLVPYFTMLKLARKSKVIYNLPTWRKNLTGGWYTMAANGVVNPEFIIDLKRRAELFAKGETDAETEALIKIMGDNGIIGQDVNANILGFTSAIYSRAMTGNDSDYQNYVKKAKDIIKNFDTVIGQKYSAVDDYTKLIIFRSEIQSFAKKLYGKSYDSLTESQKNKVHAEAAEFVKQNTPTFSRLPKWYASLARIPAGDFLSFEFESLRSFSANIRNGHQDLMKGMNDASLSKEQKAEYIKAGAKRLAGSAAIMGTRLAITSILASAALGDDDELEDDIKNNRPNWMDGHSIIPVKISKEGIATVYDYSMEDPYGSFFDLATDPLSFPAYAVDLLKPNMGISFAMNLIENKDFYGRDITNSYDDPLTKGFKYTDHTLRSLILPPFISSTLRDEQKRSEVEADKYSRLDAVGRFASRAIIRDYEYNIGTQFYYFTDQFRTKKEQYIDLTGASRSNRLAELDEIKKMYQSIVNIGIKKGNYEMIANANKNVKRSLKPAEEAYVLYGYEIPEQE